VLTRRSEVPQPAQMARRVMDRWFNDALMGPSYEASLADTAPALNVREGPEAYVVEVELAGIEPDKVEVTIEGRTLTIRGSYDESQERQGTYLLREWRSGTFLRSVALSAIVDAENARTQMRNGELILTLPKAAQHRARRLQISGETSNELGDANGEKEPVAAG